MLTGETDPEVLPFTPGGSIWTNDSRAILEIPASKDPRVNSRNRCIHEGYLSVAIIPIKSNNEVIGTLQLNDRSEGCFDLQMIEFFENLSASIGVALTHKQNEEALKESEYFFRESQRSGRIGSYRTDFVVGEWQSSDVLDEIFGIDRSYVRSVQGWLDIVHPEEKEDLHRYLVEEVIRDRKPFAKEYRIIKKNSGETRWVKGWGSTRFSQDGQIVSMIGTIQDITERKMGGVALQESEERYRTLFDRAADGIAILSADGSFLTANESFAKLHEFDLDEVLCLNIKTLCAPECVDGVLVRMDQIINGESGRFEVEHLKKNGLVFPLEISASRVVLDGKPYVQVFFHDITNRREAKRALEYYADAVVSAHEKERSRISRELHDGVLQLLGVTLSRMRGPADAVFKQTAEELLTKAIAEVRTITHNLRPSILDDLGIVAAVRSLCNDFSERTKVEVGIDVPESICGWTSLYWIGN